MGELAVEIFLKLDRLIHFFVSWVRTNNKIFSHNYIKNHTLIVERVGFWLRIDEKEPVCSG